MIKVAYIVALFGIYQSGSRHYLIKTENKAEAGFDYADDYHEAPGKFC